jgi:DNA-binding IclR family transcriptional regulator
MADLLAARTAPILAVLAETTAPLRLAEIAALVEAPLSSTQRTVDGLLRDGLVVRIVGPRPRYALAPDVPRAAVGALADWRLGERAAHGCHRTDEDDHPARTSLRDDHGGETGGPLRSAASLAPTGEPRYVATLRAVQPMRA